MDFAGGEWTLAIISIFALVIGLVLLIGSVIWLWDELVFYAGAVLLFASIITSGASFISGSEQYDAITSSHDIRQQGFTLLDVDLSQEYGQARVVGPGGCIVRRDVQQNKTNGRTTYQIVWNGKRADPSKLNCDGQ